MSLRKNRPKCCSPIHFFVKINTQYILWNKVQSPKFCAACVIVDKLSKVNNRALGENSPNLVTLLTQVTQSSPNLISPFRRKKIPFL
jgi:hypothetical protein